MKCKNCFNGIDDRDKDDYREDRCFMCFIEGFLYPMYGGFLEPVIRIAGRLVCADGEVGPDDDEPPSYPLPPVEYPDPDIPF